MRFLKPRHALSEKTLAKLVSQTESLMASANPRETCEQRFNAARERKWFIPVRSALQDMAGASRTCMFCDHNEPTDVEHFKPKAEFPGDTFSWDNLLWVCTTCN